MLSGEVGILMATNLPGIWTCSAFQTSPKPPWPSFSIRAYSETRSPF